MMEKISINDYNYPLPDERIAKYPLDNRDESKLLVFDNDKLTDSVFSEIDAFLPAESLLVYNDTKVIRARMLFNKETGAEIEIFCLEPHEPADYYLSFQQKKVCTWKCLIGNAKKWKEGSLTKVITIGGAEVNLKICKKESLQDYYVVEFTWDNSQFSFAEIIEYTGNTPIPPYLERDSEELDNFRYQTIYSQTNGSVAAPTAGLHFTPLVFDKLDEKEIHYTGITLHVGAGTFMPVKADDATQHPMHTEHFYVTRALLERLLYYGNNVTAVGTTSLRALESIYWMGIKLMNKAENPFELGQWEAYHLERNVNILEVWKILLKYIKAQPNEEIAAATSIMIIPGYKIKTVKRLITNFHQPKSTLLLLVAAFVGKDKWKLLYQHALDNGYRFLSYGDSSLLNYNE